MFSGNNEGKIFKVVLIGGSSVGKSSIVSKFIFNEFNENQYSTIGAAFITKTIVIDNINVKLELWDTAGQEKFDSLVPMYYRNAHAVIVVYDVTDKETFDRAKRWITQINDQWRVF